MLFVLSFLIGFAGTRWLVGALRVLDRPNERSSHIAPTPRGGGLAILSALLSSIAWIVVTMGWPLAAWAIAPLVGGVAVALVSWVDDVRSLPWTIRLGVQVLAVMIAIVPITLQATMDPVQAIVLIGILGFAWLWLVNAFNFVDGIDGLIAVQTIAITLGASLVFVWIGAPAQLTALAGALAAATAGFLAWNRPPAAIFLGDVGSVPLGFLCGFFLVVAGYLGAWGAALALPAYVYADATLTLLTRWRNGEKLTEPHRKHAYQRAAGRTPAGHAAVTARVGIAQVLILGAVALGLWTGGARGQLLTLAAAAIIVAALLAELERLARRRLAAEAAA